MSTFKFENSIELDRNVKEQFAKLSEVIETTSADIRTIAVTSSQNEEGKTFISFHLACSLAQKGYRVLIVMADMRKTTAIGDLPVMGVIDVCEGKVEVEEVIYKTDIEGIDVIFSGATKKNENLDLGRKVYSVMMKCLKEDYNYIIIDMPTLSKTDNDEVLIKESDASILVVQPNRSSKGKIQKNIKLLEAYNCKVLGAIRNNK